MSHLLKIIGQELVTLSSLIEHMQNTQSINSVEVDIALRKVNDIYNELLLVRDDKKSDLVYLDKEKPIKAKQNIESISLETKPKSIDEVPPNQKKYPQAPVPKTPSIDVTHHPEQKTIVSSADVEKKEIKNLEQIKDNAIDKNPYEKKIVIPDNTIEKNSSKKTEEKEIPELIPDTKIEKETIKTETKKKKPILSENPAPETKIINDDISGEIIADKFHNNSPSVNDLLPNIKKNRDLASKLKDRPITNINKTIKLNDRIWYINELFNRDADLFKQVVDTLEEMPTLDEALAFIFEKFDWNQEDKSTISFLELIFRRFAN